MEFNDLIKNHMRKDIVYTTPDERLADVIFKMSHVKTDIAVVKSKDDLVGVITESDIYFALVKDVSRTRLPSKINPGISPTSKWPRSRGDHPHKRLWIPVNASASTPVWIHTRMTRSRTQSASCSEAGCIICSSTTNTTSLLAPSPQATSLEVSGEARQRNNRHTGLLLNPFLFL